MATKYRMKLNAATMLGQSKTVIQAEIDASAELIDFIKFVKIVNIIVENYSTNINLIIGWMHFLLRNWLNINQLVKIKMSH